MWSSSWSSRGRRVHAAGVRRGLSFLSGEISAGVLGCPSIAVVGWQGTVAAVRLLLAAEKSAEAVVPSGSKIAGKGRTRSRALGRLGTASWNDVGAGSCVTPNDVMVYVSSERVGQRVMASITQYVGSASSCA